MLFLCELKYKDSNCLTLINLEKKKHRNIILQIHLHIHTISFISWKPISIITNHCYTLTDGYTLLAIIVLQLLLLCSFIYLSYDILQISSQNPVLRRIYYNTHLICLWLLCRLHLSLLVLISFLSVYVFLYVFV